MAYNISWVKWIHSSVIKYVTDTLTTAGVPFHVEGGVRKTGKLDDFVEVRIDGPHSNEPSSGFYILRLEVNLLVQTNLEVDKNLYKHAERLGLCVNTLDAVIPVYKYGSDAADDGTQIGCLTIVDEKPRDYVKVNDFGQLETNVRLRMASVEAHYEIELRG